MSRYFTVARKDVKENPTAKPDKRPKHDKSNNGTSKDPSRADPFKGNAPIPDYKLAKYTRGNKLETAGLKTKIRRQQLKKWDNKVIQATEQTARAELLLSEDVGYLEAEDGEETYKISQQQIANSVDITSATKFFELNLNEFGPYRMDYYRNGRYLVIGGKRGHVAALDWVTKKLLCEINVMESVHDICWLHMPTMFATAQKNWVFVYDTQGTELHCIKKLNRVTRMEFLPYHFLLATASEKGFLSWLDISIGKMITETYTKAGCLQVLTQNPQNAILITGHTNGTISMWSPNNQEPLVKMLCHPHPIRAVAVDTQGLYLATSGLDRSLKIWDIRNYKCLQSYKLGAAPGHLSFSQRGLIAAGLGNIVEIYKDCCTQTTSAPYIRHKVPSTVADLSFCPYEDVIGISHNRGFSSMLVPGAGEPNFDAFESNPFMTKSQRREMEVKALLEKIQPEMISLNPSRLGEINVPSLKKVLEEKKKILYVKPKKIEFDRHKKKVVQKRKKSYQKNVKRKKENE